MTLDRPSPGPRFLVALSATFIAAASTAHAQSPARPPAAAGAVAPSQAAPTTVRSGSYRAALEELVARPSGLRVDDVATRAVTTSYDLRQRRAEVLAAAAGVDQAMVAYYPRLTALARYARLSNVESPVLGNFVVAPGAAPGPLPAGQVLVSAPARIEVFPNSTTFQATLAVPLLDYLQRFPALNAAARSNHAAAGWTERATQAQIDAESRVVYYSWVRARMQTVVAEQALRQAQTHLGQVKRALEVGAVSRADVLRVDAQVAGAEVFVARARDFDAVMEDQLRTMLHEEGLPHYEIGEDVRQDLPVETLPAPGTLLDEAWANRGELRALREGGKALKAQADVERAARLPRLDLFADGIYANPNPRYLPPRNQFDATWDAGVQLSWTPNDLASAGHAARGAEARATANQAQEGVLKDAVRREIIGAHAGVRSADDQVRSAGRQLDSSEESYRVRFDLYQAGRASNIEMTDAETDLTQAALSLVNGRIDQRIARVRLKHAVGRDLGETK